MNKATNIHLAQTLFSIDEIAYNRLKKYLDQLERLFKNTEGAKDILEDIEARIAELFTDLKKDERYVISVEDVEKVIDTLGTPEDLAGEDAEQDSPSPSQPKKLYRDPDDRFIGGVAGGLSHYIGLDSVWIRLILLILFFSSVGGVVLVYILLWILVSEAKTTAEKLMMKGEPVNVSNIKKKIKEELDQVSEKVKDVDYENMGSQLKKKSKDFSDFLLSVAKGIVKILTLLIGIFMLFIAGMVLLGLFISAIIGSVFSAMIPHELIQFGLSLNLPLFVLGFFALLIVGIPFVFLFMLGLQLLAQNKSIMSRMTKLILLGLWILALITLLVFGIVETKSFAISAKQNSMEMLDQQTADTLKVYLNDDHKQTETVTVFNHFTLIEDEDENQYRLDRNVRININQNNANTIELSVEKNARGWQQKQAIQNAEAIDYKYDYFDHQLILDGFWLSPIENKTHPENVGLNLLIPQGQYVYLDQDLGKYLSSQIENDQDFYRKRIAGHLWKMENNTLICQDCEHIEGTVRFDDEQFNINIKDDDSTLELNIDETGVAITKKEN